MPQAPWEADRPLDLETAAAVVARQFPELRPLRLRWLGAGWDNDAYLANECWVFRFPRRRDVVPTLERERTLLPIVAAALELAVPVPVLRGEPCDRFPYPFAAHRFIPGVPADRLPVASVDEPAIAAAMGRALAWLHAIPRERLPVGLPVEEDRCAAFQDWVVRCAEHFRRAMPRAVVARWEPWLRGEVPRPPPGPGPDALGHNDLGAEHVLLDPETRTVCGILDWADAAIVDRASDFAGLHLWRGDAFLDRVLESYSRPLDAGFPARVRFLSTAIAITLVAESRAAGDEPGLTRWRRFFLEVFEPRTADLAP